MRTPELRPGAGGLFAVRRVGRREVVVAAHRNERHTELLEQYPPQRDELIVGRYFLGAGPLATVATTGDEVSETQHEVGLHGVEGSDAVLESRALLRPAGVVAVGIRDYGEAEAYVPAIWTSGQTPAQSCRRWIVLCRGWRARHTHAQRLGHRIIGRVRGGELSRAMTLRSGAGLARHAPRAAIQARHTTQSHNNQEWKRSSHFPPTHHISILNHLPSHRTNRISSSVENVENNHRMNQSNCLSINKVPLFCTSYVL